MMISKPKIININHHTTKSYDTNIYIIKDPLNKNNTNVQSIKDEIE